jgi:hypothetical protein
VSEMREKIRTENVIWKFVSQASWSGIIQHAVKDIIPLNSILGLIAVSYQWINMSDNFCKTQ